MSEGELLSCCTNREQVIAGRGSAMNSMTWFMFVVGIAAVVIYWMTTRAGSRGAARRSGSDGSGTDSNFGGSSSSGNGWSLASWLGGDGSFSHNSGSSSDSGGDSGGGGGGGDGGGGGGGD
jgi:hypothetical protein